MHTNATPIESPIKRFLNREEAAAFSGLSVSTLNALERAGKLSFLRPSSRRVLIDRVALEAFLLASATTRGRTESAGKAGAQ
jgi:excisionase family DNA binding protein